jgi:hypothetical protein
LGKGTSLALKAQTLGRIVLKRRLLLDQKINAFFPMLPEFGLRKAFKALSGVMSHEAEMERSWTPPKTVF